MSLLRSFIAIEIPPDIHKALDNTIAPLRKKLPASLVKWVPVGNIHVTLKFLGDVSPSNIEMLISMLDAEAGQQAVFEMNVRGMGAFPNANRPRVIWVGIQAPPALESLHKALEAAAARLGYEPERRRFSPHLTVGRVKRDLRTGSLADIRSALDQMDPGPIGVVPVTAVHLFKSDLRPSGAVYTRLHSAPLGKA